jgi:hypothetical protein
VQGVQVVAVVLVADRAQAVNAVLQEAAVAVVVAERMISSHR